MRTLLEAANFDCFFKTVVLKSLSFGEEVSRLTEDGEVLRLVLLDFEDWAFDRLVDDEQDSQLLLETIYD